MNHNKRGRLGAFLSGAFMAAALGGYLFFGSKNKRRNRQKAEDWMEDAKAEVASRVKKIKRLTRDKYNDIVDSVSEKYSEMKEAGREKADELKEALKDKWDEIAEEAREEDEE